MIHTGFPVTEYVDVAVRHVLLRQGVIGLKEQFSTWVIIMIMTNNLLCLMNWLWTCKRWKSCFLTIRLARSVQKLLTQTLSRSESQRKKNPTFRQLLLLHQLQSSQPPNKNKKVVISITNLWYLLHEIQTGTIKLVFFYCNTCMLNVSIIGDNLSLEPGNIRWQYFTWNNIVWSCRHDKKVHQWWDVWSRPKLGLLLVWLIKYDSYNVSRTAPPLPLTPI